MYFCLSLISFLIKLGLISIKIDREGENYRIIEKLITAYGK